MVISTARRGDLFGDLLSDGSRRELSHDDIAGLLADDAANIFADARYIRSVADAAAAAPWGRFVGEAYTDVQASRVFR